MKFKYRFLLALCAAALLSGCGHTHQTSGVWQADAEKHWQTCADCGQTAEEAAHTLDESGVCALCGAEVIDWGDSRSVYQYNEHGDLLRSADYDADGTVITETVNTYEYDADGMLLRAAAMTDGVLTEESDYTVVDGECVISRLVGYMTDGSHYVDEYDTFGNVVRMTTYNAEGALDQQMDSEYALLEDGQWVEVQSTITEADGTRFVSGYSETGDQVSAVHYEADGSVASVSRWDYTYDEDGNWKTVQYFCNGALTTDMIYATEATEDGSTTYPQTVTEYAEDGGWTVTVNDADGNVLSETRYDAAGNELA